MVSAAAFQSHPSLYPSAPPLPKWDDPGMTPEYQLRGRIERVPVGLCDRAKYIGKAAFVALGYLVGFFIFHGLTLGTVLGYRLYTHFANKPMNQKIEEARVNALIRALDESGIADKGKAELLEDLKGKVPYKDALVFVDHVLTLRNELFTMKRAGANVSIGSVESLYDRFKNMVRDERFLRVFKHLNATEPVTTSVTFLKHLAIRFRSAQVGDILVEHAKDRFKTEDQISIEKTGQILRESLGEFGFKRNTLFQKAAWMFTNPFAFFHSFKSGQLPGDYDSTESNPTYTVEQFSHDGVNVHVTAGPTPFNDPIYSEIFLSAADELRFNIMDTSNTAEHEMIQRMQAVADRSGGRLTHNVFGFVTKEKQNLLEKETVNELIDHYQDRIIEKRSLDGKPKKDYGVSISDTSLTEEQIRSAVGHAKGVFKEGVDLSNSKTKHAVLVAVETMFIMGSMMNHLKRLKAQEKRDAYIAIACKQCFDRGPVYVGAFLLYLRAWTQDEQRQHQKAAGLPLIRAPLSESRDQIYSKFAVYNELTKILDSTRLGEQVRNYVKTFDPQQIGNAQVEQAAEVLGAS